MFPYSLIIETSSSFAGHSIRPKDLSLFIPAHIPVATPNRPDVYDTETHFHSMEGDDGTESS